MPKFLILPLALSVAVILGGCSRSENPTSPTVSSSPAPWRLIGSWKVQSATLDGVALPLIDVLHWPATTLFELIEIGDTTYGVGDFDFHGVLTNAEFGTLDLNGQYLTFTVKTVNGQPLNPSVQKSYQWAKSGDNLTLTINDGGKNVVIECVPDPLTGLGYWDY